MIECEVLVVGAGPAGCATAIGAARKGLVTVLLDRVRPARRWAGESLPPGTGKLMHSVFGPGILSEDRHQTAVGSRSVWGSPELIEADFLMNPLGEGWLLDRQAFDESARHAAQSAGARIIPVRHLGPFTRGSSGWQLDLGDGNRIAARFLVDASGRSAALLRRLRIPRIAADRQIAIVASFADNGDTWSGTTVEAVREGWLYTTPLPGKRRVLAYLTDDDLWRQGSRDWQALLGETIHVARLAGTNASLARPAAYPAGTAQVDRLFGEDWLAVGDAAVSFDPLSSQGLAAAVLMGARAGDALAEPERQPAIDEWAEAYAMLIAEHADLKAHYARLETRFPDSLFWRRRQEPDDAIIRPRGLATAARA